MRAFCGSCGGLFALKVDGTLRAHKRFVPFGKYGGSVRWKPCEGAGQKPEGDFRQVTA